MNYRPLIRILGLLVALFSVTMLPPALVAFYYGDGGGLAFVLAFFYLLIFGCVLWFPNRNAYADLRVREGFLIVVLFWTVLGSIGALPILISPQPDLGLVDALFESFSALTTTGATVITGLDSLPKAILFYRQQLQWLGGMGIIVLAVAVLPMLGIGGMQLYRAETPGPVKDSKMTPRIADTAKHLWYIYLTLTVTCAAAYWAAGMSLFDAVCHAFSTIAIGGFSTHDASMGYFNSPTINLICVVFLLISGCNFALHYSAWSGRSLRGYFKDPELRMFLLLQGCMVMLCFWMLHTTGVYSNAASTFDHALFQAVSISTTAGFATTGFHEWPLFLPILLIFSSFVGGPLVGQALSALRDHIPDVETRVAAIFRQGRAIRPQGTTVIEADDEVFFVADTRHIRTVMGELQRLERKYRKIMIAGGGNIGKGLAKELSKSHQVKLIERNPERADYLGSALRDVTVFCGDASDQELLIEEHIDQSDVFIAVTNDDEANIMSAMLAKRLGVGRTMVLIQRGAYVDLVQGGEIDIAISPQQATISAMLTHVRKGDMVNVFSLRRGAAEAIEAIAHGDENMSKVVGRTIRDIKLPPGTTIGAVVRGEEVLIAHDNTIIETNDHVILFLVDKKYITDVEKLFQPSPFFFF